MQAKLLLIDNTASLMHPWKKALETRYRTIEAVGGVEAVRKIKSESVELAVVNISLRNVNGVEAISKIRSKYDRLPVIVLYDKRDVLDVRQARAYNVNALLPLPVDFNRLVSEIQKLLPPSPVPETDTPFTALRAAAAAAPATRRAAPSDDSLDVEQRYYDGLSAIAANDLDQAIGIFESLISITRLKKESWRRYLEEALFQLGQCHAARGEYEKSCSYYAAFISKAPHNSSLKSALLYLGKNYLALKNKEKAAYYLKKLINTTPFDSYCTQARKLLKTIA